MPARIRISVLFQQISLLSLGLRFLTLIWPLFLHEFGPVQYHGQSNLYAA